MPEAISILFKFLLEYGDDALAFVSGLVKSITSGRLDRDDILVTLRPYLEDDAWEALEKVLYSDQLNALYRDADDVLS